ncbi:hypothetical protein FF1_000803 [Malus domestica]|uniref:Uncharacterized protein n=1 Tax=Malus domestica TaxID=3750 RepID=A0A498KJ51_MALDO|nr:hypothetical protein DVH24_009769 [Malus domestica]
MAFLFSSRAYTTPRCLSLTASARMISKNPSSAALVNPTHMRTSDKAMRGEKREIVKTLKGFSDSRCLSGRCLARLGLLGFQGECGDGVGVKICGYFDLEVRGGWCGICGGNRVF